MAVKFSEMTAEQKQQAFEKWAARREEGKVNSTAKRQAVKALIAKYQGDYDKLLAQFGGKKSAAAAAKK